MNPVHPVTIVVADEVHERTMYTQMIIGLVEVNLTMILILMSATVDVAELKVAIPVARATEIDRHAFDVKRFFLQRDVTRHANVLERSARLIVSLHHACANCNLVEGVPKGQFCDRFLVFCPGKNILIRW